MVLIRVLRSTRLWIIILGGLILAGEPAGAHPIRITAVTVPNVTVDQTAVLNFGQIAAPTNVASQDFTLNLNETTSQTGGDGTFLNDPARTLGQLALTGDFGTVLISILLTLVNEGQCNASSGTLTGKVVLKEVFGSQTSGVIPLLVNVGGTLVVDQNTVGHVECFYTISVMLQ